MSDIQTDSAVLDAPSEGQEPIVNDLTIHVATVNGSGSQSSNNVLMRSIFQMGVPVSGKNMFPSNIAGLPTWFTIRANKDGWIARKKEVDLMICMNAQTAKEDVEGLPAGAMCIYDAPLNCRQYRNDVAFFEVPFAKLAAEFFRARALFSAHVVEPGGERALQLCESRVEARLGRGDSRLQLRCARRARLHFGAQARQLFTHPARLFAQV